MLVAMQNSQDAYAGCWGSGRHGASSFGCDMNIAGFSIRIRYHPVQIALDGVRL